MGNSNSRDGRDKGEGRKKSSSSRGPVGEDFVGDSPIGGVQVLRTDSGGQWPKFAVSSVQGHRKTMEDEFVAGINLESLKPGLPPTAMFGVFDGHGGSECSAYLRKHLPGAIAEAAATQDLTHALRSAFVNTDRGFIEQVGLLGEDSGSTAVVVLVQHGRIIVAHAGDSRAVIRQAGAPRVLTKDHKPTRPDEMARIERSGGCVVLGRVNGRLAVSRAFGNKPMKNCVTAEPEVSSQPLTQVDEMMILASDGLWDVMDEGQAFRTAQEAINQGKGMKGAAKALTDLALNEGTRDNTTVVVIDIGMRAGETRAASAPPGSAYSPTHSQSVDWPSGSPMVGAAPYHHVSVDTASPLRLSGDSSHPYMRSGEQLLHPGFPQSPGNMPRSGSGSPMGGVAHVMHSAQYQQ